MNVIFYNINNGKNIIEIEMPILPEKGESVAINGFGYKVEGRCISIIDKKISYYIGLEYVETHK